MQAKDLVGATVRLDLPDGSLDVRVLGYEPNPCRAVANAPAYLIECHGQSRWIPVKAVAGRVLIVPNVVLA